MCSLPHFLNGVLNLKEVPQMRQAIIIFACLLLLFATSAYAQKADDAALIEAAKNGDLSGVKSALSRGTSSNTKDENGTTVLTWASYNGHEDVVKLLLDKGAEVDAKHSTDGRTAMWFASQEGHAEVVKLLLEKGAEVNTKRTTTGATSLLLASKNGHIEVVKLLLEKGAEVNVRTIDGKWTALKVAKLKRHTEIMQLLKKAGANE